MKKKINLLDCLNPVQKTHKDDKNVNNIYIELLNKSALNQKSIRETKDNKTDK
jgi:hypothetical protein